MVGRQVLATTYAAESIGNITLAFSGLSAYHARAGQALSISDVRRSLNFATRLAITVKILSVPRPSPTSIRSATARPK